MASRKRGGKNQGGWISAEDLMAEFMNDPEIVRVRQEQDRQVEEARALAAKVEQPVVTDLREAGVHVASVWDLVNGPTPPAAISVLRRHLRGGHPPGVVEGVARGLAVPEAVDFWEELAEVYEGCAGDLGVEVGLATALDAGATPDRSPTLRNWILDPRRGDSRTLLFQALARMVPEEAAETYAQLQRQDPEFASYDAVVEAAEHAGVEVNNKKRGSGRRR